MPTAVKDHRSKKNPQSHEAWNKRKTAINAADKSHKWFQTEWRKLCLHARMLADKMTDKNWVEAKALGINGFIKGEIAPGVVISGTI